MNRIGSFIVFLCVLPVLDCRYPASCSGLDLYCNPLAAAFLLRPIRTRLLSDFNGDKIPDGLAAAYFNQGAGAADKGVAYVFYGSLAGLTAHQESASPYSCSGAIDCTAIQNPDDETSGFFGKGIAAVGDVNGDGYSDLAVGAYQNQGSGAANKGAAYIFYGGANGITAHPTSASGYSCTGPPDCTVIENPEDSATGLFFGYTVAAAGDVNGDGYADVIISGHQNDGAGAADKGAAYIFYGSKNGITLHPENAIAYVCNGPPDCTVIQNPDNENTGQFGVTVASAGDVNRDGYSDVIMGANQNQGAGAVNKGAAYIFYGGPAGPTSHPLSASTYTCSGPPDCTVIQNPDDEASGFFGSNVAGAGDVNGDGYADVVVGAQQNQGAGIADKGTAYIFYGSATGITSHPESATAYTCSGPPDCTVVENPENENVGLFAEWVAPAGDVNRDGYADVAIGSSYDQGAGAADKGAVYVFYGNATGIMSHPENATAYSCNGPPDCTVIQNPDNEGNGYFARVLGDMDLNGDGYADLLTAAVNNQGAGAADKGVVYAFYGGPTGLTNHPLSATAYACTGPPDCTAVQNPDNEASGIFGTLK